jgi:hypothetical protein
MKRRIVITVFAAMMLSMVVQGICAPDKIVLPKSDSRWYTSDSAFVWRPRQIYVIWMDSTDVNLEFRLPYEHERSGVSNLLLRDKKTGKTHMIGSRRLQPPLSYPFRAGEI